jgi:hypothetical protein
MALTADGGKVVQKAYKKGTENQLWKLSIGD